MADMIIGDNAERLKELDLIFNSLHNQPAKSQPNEKWVWIYGKRGATIEVIKKSE